MQDQNESYSLISSTTRIETIALENQYENQRFLTHWFPAQQGLKLNGQEGDSSVYGVLLTDFQHNKDWNYFKALACRNTLSLLTDFQHNKDWNGTTSKRPPASSGTYSLISSTTRIETTTAPAKMAEHPFLLTDFQHNKDWNNMKELVQLQGQLLTHWFPAQQGLKPEVLANNFGTDWPYSLISSTTRIETSPVRFRSRCASVLTHWFPAQQGLKLHQSDSALAVPRSYSLISSTTRIETHASLFGTRRKARLTHWFPAQQGLKLHFSIWMKAGTAFLLTDFQHNKDWNMIFKAQDSAYALLTHWFPAQQGLKPSWQRIINEKLKSYSLISSTTRIETKWVTGLSFKKYNLLTDFQHNKDWNFLP